MATKIEKVITAIGKWIAIAAVTTIIVILLGMAVQSWVDHHTTTVTKIYVYDNVTNEWELTYEGHEG